MRRFVWLLCCGLAGAATPLDAAPPNTAAPNTAAPNTAAPNGPSRENEPVGRPVELIVAPPEIVLTGPRSSQQLIVSGRYADGSLRDLTRFCEWRAAGPELVAVTPQGRVSGLDDGATRLEIRVGERTAQIPVTVGESRQPQTISFRREVMPVLSAAGCSDIRCHGAPSGKNGFRLSLWGADPALDYQQLTRDALGRRTSAVAPDQSLILLKALTRVSHAGGRRFAWNSPFEKLLRSWQAEGIRDDAPASELRELTVTPSRRVLRAPAQWQQLAVQAAYDDGATADVTSLTTYSTTDLAVATVDPSGFVEFKRQGEVAILCRFLGRMTTVRLTHIAEPSPDFQWTNPPEHNVVDRHVFAKLRMLHIAPSDICSDEEFIRRLFLDVAGALPTPAEARDFLAETAPDKRARWIDRILQRPAYADCWTKKWTDVLRVSRDSIQLAGAQAFQHWLREQIAEDVSLADTAAALLTSQGESYGAPAANFFCVTPTPAEAADPLYLQKDLAEATAQLFLGVRLQCAQCHNHPYERWTQDDYLGLAAFFSQVRRTRLGKAGPSGRPDRRQMAIAIDLQSAELAHPETGASVAPHFPGQPPAALDPQQDRRRQLADWLTNQDNPFFAKAVVNRVWFHLFGRGIVEPVDDFRDSNPAANDPLLTALAEEFKAGGYQLRPLIRTILNSRAYQLSSLSNASNENDAVYFSHMFARPLPAEVLLDAICDVTGVPERYEIMKDYITGIPTEAVSFPIGTRAMQLPVNDFLTLINESGKYVRYESHPFLRTFGQPNRTQTCECDREQKFSRKQALELSVGPIVSNKVAHRENRLAALLASGQSDAEILSELYWRALSRAPSESAAQSLLRHVADSPDKRLAWEDVLWTILNSQEFIYQH